MEFLLSLAVTLAAETGTYIIFRHKSLKLFFVVSLLNLILNPLMNIWLRYAQYRETYYFVLALAEVATILIESVFIYPFIKEKYLKVLLYSLIANFVSFIIGFIFSFTSIYETVMTIYIVTGVFVAIYFLLYLFILLSFISNYKKNSNRCDSGN